VALFQRTPEGFVFSSKAAVKEDNLEPDVAKAVIVPTASTGNPPTLHDINLRPRPSAPLPDQAKKKTTGGKSYACFDMAAMLCTICSIILIDCFLT